MKKFMSLVCCLILSQSLFAAGTGAKIKISYKPDGATEENSCKISSEEIDKVKSTGAGTVCADLISKTDKKEITMSELSVISTKIKLCYIGKDAAVDKAGLVEIVNKWTSFLDNKDGGWKVTQTSIDNKAVVVKVEKEKSSFNLSIDLTCPQPAAK